LPDHTPGSACPGGQRSHFRHAGRWDAGMRPGPSRRHNVLGCPGTWVCLLKGLLLLGSFREKLVKLGLLLTQCFTG
jgi:hypothetical protein